jgi:hypothetical protein
MFIRLVSMTHHLTTQNMIFNEITTQNFNEIVFWEKTRQEMVKPNFHFRTVLFGHILK